MASDVFFEEGSGELNIDESRDVLLKLAKFFQEPEIQSRRFRVEGHTDSTPVENSKYPSNWELSVDRALNTLHFLGDFGVDESKFSVAGYADTRPVFSNDTKEAQAYNRRVDIIILDEGHF